MEQILANGVYLGSQYAMIALGLTLIFALMNVLNFAHGQMYVIGGFVTYTFYGQWGVPFVLALSYVVLHLGDSWVRLIERFLFAPVIKGSAREESTMLLAAGIAFFLDAVILLVFGEKQRGVPKIVDGVFNYDFRLIMPYDRILICVLAILSIIAFIGLMQYTKTGRALRALAQDRTAAQLMGVNVDRYSMIGFALGAMLAGLVGGLLVTITGVNLRYGRANIDQSLYDGDDRWRRCDFWCDLGWHYLRLYGGHWSRYLLYQYGDITYLLIFVSLMIFLAIRPQGLMGKPWG